ncbi:hypothetical protein HY338_00805 [Candidatus Gottesmanbacteria bacterium]|nr:hypothetical protein [Candidatus Gottesmanbacteria bacterium]
MEESITPKKSIRFASHFLIFYLIIFGIIILLGFFLIKLSNQENNLNIDYSIENIPTLIPITLLPNPSITGASNLNKKEIMQAFVLNANLFLNYLQAKEVENLYLLLTIDAQKLNSREDLKTAFGQSEIKITSFSLQDGKPFPSSSSGAFVESSENENLEMILPITINYITKSGEKKSISREMHAKYQNNLWRFDYLELP